LLTGEASGLRAYLDLDLIGITGWICDERWQAPLVAKFRASGAPRDGFALPPPRNRKPNRTRSAASRHLRICAHRRARSTAPRRAAAETLRNARVFFGCPSMNQAELLHPSARWLPERPAIALGARRWRPGARAAHPSSPPDSAIGSARAATG
jgi:hypothetical protein